MKIDDYVFKGVRRAVGDILYFQDTIILKKVKKSFNEEWTTKIRGVKPYLMYNPSNETLGIYLHKNGQDILIKDGTGLSEGEKTLVDHLYLAVEREITKLQGPRERFTPDTSDEPVPDHSKDDKLERMMLSAKKEQDEEFVNDDPDFEIDESEIDLK